MPPPRAQTDQERAENSYRQSRRLLYETRFQASNLLVDVRLSRAAKESGEWIAGS